MPAAARRSTQKLGRPASATRPKHWSKVPPNRLQALRERGKTRAGGFWLTLEEMGKLMGLSPSAVSRHETGQRGLTDADVLRYAQVLKVRPHQLFAHLTVDKPSR